MSRDRVSPALRCAQAVSPAWSCENLNEMAQVALSVLLRSVSSLGSASALDRSVLCLSVRWCVFESRHRNSQRRARVFVPLNVDLFSCPSRSMNQVVRATTIMSHVRAATPGLAVIDVNCHPFRIGIFT